MKQDITQLWNEFKNLPYPAEAHIAEKDFELSESTIAGCIDSYLATTRLEDEKREALKGSLEYLNLHESELPSEARSYFEKLQALGRSVLQEVS